MSNLSLRDRQVSLLRHLTSAEVIFDGVAEDAIDPALRGLDLGRLRLEAQFSFDKRIAKIAGVLPRTCEYLGGLQQLLLPAFAAACPPHSINRHANARQFYDFLCAHWEEEPAEPPYLPDIAAYEIAFNKVRSYRETEGSAPESGGDHVRRHSSVELLRCGHDIRPLFEEGSHGGAPHRRDIRLAIALPPGSDAPRVFELGAPVFELLELLDDWAPLADLGTGETHELRDLFHGLTTANLVEHRP